MNRLVASPCSLPQMPLPELLHAYSKLGFRKLEAFTSWAAAHLDPTSPAEHYLALARTYGIRYTSLHLPPVDRADPSSVDRALTVARFAAELGVGVVLYKAANRPSYIDCAPAFLDGLPTGLTAVVQNHAGTAVSSFADVCEVMDGIADPRMKLLLEVGHFAVVGQHWDAPCDRYGDRIALVHVKDIADGTPVPFGRGTVDFDSLCARLDTLGYSGDVVVEIEVDVDDTARLTLMADACQYLYAHGLTEI